mmetsp:Transcript_12494/g.20370  ORF Transcript_12494/g.20370 Transcript_12494/m.20370 type:complete len:92 (+) Transcript_12494:446-721(+)
MGREGMVAEVGAGMGHGRERKGSWKRRNEGEGRGGEEQRIHWNLVKHSQFQLVMFLWDLCQISKQKQDRAGQAGVELQCVAGVEGRRLEKM